MRSKGKKAAPMTTLVLTNLDSTLMADPLGVRVASQIEHRGLSPAGSRSGAAKRSLPHLSERATSEMEVSVEELESAATAHGRMVSELAKHIEGMQRGDEHALEDLYDATVGKLFALASAILRSAEDAEEVVCATYSYAWANAKRFDGARANALGWLLMLCRSRSLDRLRKRRLHGATVDIAEIANFEAADGERPDDLLALMQQRSRVRTALATLSPERRKLVSLAFLEGLSHQEIATVSGLALGTVKSHVRRALVQLREVLEIE